MGIFRDPRAITDVIAIMERTLNFIDVRLSNHGRRVAYIVYQLLWPTGRFTPREMRDICLLALLHDIGAYKTEEIDNMVDFETQETMDHSVYGYLFFKHFSPLRDLAPAILHHHTACDQLDMENPLDRLAQVLFIADRLDILTLSHFSTKEDLYARMNQQRDITFNGELLDMILQQHVKLPVYDADVLGESEISRALHAVPLEPQEVAAYLKMIVLFIDMRSHQTLTHTIATTSIAGSLSRLMGLSGEECMKLEAASWLHDIGKTGVPLKVLEKPARLTTDEMRTVQQHVNHTEKILHGNVLEDVCHIACHHHEKLDGSGYPDGLGAGQLTTCQRIVVVADIFSALNGVRSYKTAFPRDDVIATLLAMTDDGLLDAVVVDAAIRHYDEIEAEMQRSVKPYEQRFEEIQRDFARLCEAQAPQM